MIYTKLILPLLLLSVPVYSYPDTHPVTPEQRSKAQIALHMVKREIAIAKVLEHLRKSAPTVALVIHNVRVVDVALGSIIPDQSVVSSEGRIIWVGDVASEPKLPNEKVIDGKNQYLGPGLTDMHVHSSSASGWLLDLANGVTGVRDMAGFPWMLKARYSINAGKMLGPSLAIAGPLINGSPLEGYAVVPADPLDAMRIVREEAACGYNFVKVHNIVPLPIFDAVAKQAAIEGMDLVGHVPHDISVRHAATAGMRTMEHLKGFINDATLKLGEQDYAAVVEGQEVWNTPTLYAMRAYARGPEANAYLASPDMRFVSRRRREAWSHHLEMPEKPEEKLGREAIPIMKSIVGKLHEVNAKFLAGTDADNYPFQIMGFALIDELQLLQDAGLRPVEALRAATIEAANAMREPFEFGQIKKGMRADMVLLTANPLDGTSAYRANTGVMVHGIWLDRLALNTALDHLASIYAEDEAATVFSKATAQAALSEARSLTDQGFVFDSGFFSLLANSLREAGAADLADQADRLADVPTVGPCAEQRP